MDGLNRDFWRGRKVFVTGHTGFKGAWLSLWLADLGAQVTGYALRPPTQPNLYELAGIADKVRTVTADIRDREKLHEAMQEAEPDIVLHLAAQPLVLDSYRNPAETYEINVMGTVNLLEAVRRCPAVRAVVNVTTDKCYENQEWVWGYRENDRLGGADPYSSSKACSELVTSAYRQSFFAGEEHRPAVATARAGNVIGGGDWAPDRLLADCFRALLAGEKIRLRNPGSIRPWQHVLEPLYGYLTLAERLAQYGDEFAGAWNFGPAAEDAQSVAWVVKTLCGFWGEDADFEIAEAAMHQPNETRYLRLDAAKSREKLDWQPRWSTRQAVRAAVDWTKGFRRNADLQQMTLDQIHEYERQAAEQP